MRMVYNTRACAVLYNVLKSNNIAGTVLIPSNICESVPATYMLLGINPIFCDVSIDDYQLDKSCAIRLIKDKKINILHYNHTYGYDSEEDIAFLERIKYSFPDVFIIDDKCLCFPEFLLNDTVADISLYSTGPVKCVDIGWGGYGIIKDNLIYEENNLVFNSNDLIEFDKHVKKCHCNDSPVNKKILLSNWLEISSNYQGNYWDDVKARSRESLNHKLHINEIYCDIPGSLPIEYCNWRYQLLLENANECIKAIFEAGLFCSNHYKSLGNGYFSDVNTPNNFFLEKHIVNLFNDFRFSYEQAKMVAELLKIIAIPVNR